MCEIESRCDGYKVIATPVADIIHCGSCRYYLKEQRQCEKIKTDVGLKEHDFCSQAVLKADKLVDLNLT